MEQNEKAERLKNMLDGELQPLHEKIDWLEDEVKSLQEDIKSLMKLLSSKE